MQETSFFSGAITALITPFRNGKFDEDAYVALIERQIAAGVHGLVPVGTTGESATLSHEEHRHAVNLCVQTTRGRVPVVAGCGSNSTQEAIELLEHAKQVGADAALVVTPYYNRPSQAGLVAHYTALTEAVALPIILYNVPSRTACDMLPETVGELSALPNIIGLKDATGDLSRVARHRTLCLPDFVLLSGDDPSALGFIAHGGTGCISVTSNVAPVSYVEMIEHALVHRFAEAAQVNNMLADLHRQLFVEPSPAPAKWACQALGLCQADVRLPLLPLSPDGQSKLLKAMRTAGIDV